MLTASRPGPGAGRREAAAAARPWPVNAIGRRLTEPAVDGARPAEHRNGPSLGSLLVCDGCDRPLQRSWGPDSIRTYVFLCGCQRVEVDAELVERLIRDRVEAEPALQAVDIRPEEFPMVVRGLFAAVRIGHSAEDLKFVWRI